MVKLLVNEKEYVVPGCNHLYCPLSDFKKVCAAAHSPAACATDPAMTAPFSFVSRRSTTPCHSATLTSCAALESMMVGQ